jgi:hypothetical protein
LFDHCLEFYLDTRGFFPKNSLNHSVMESRSLPRTALVHSFIFQRRTNCLGPPKEFLRVNRDIFTGNIRLVLALPRSSFGLAESSLHNDYFCNNACAGLCCHFLWANQDIFAWHHMACLGPPKEPIKIKCRTSSSPPLGQPRHHCMAPYNLSCPSKELITPRE